MRLGYLSGSDVTADFVSCYLVLDMTNPICKERRIPVNGCIGPDGNGCQLTVLVGGLALSIQMGTIVWERSRGLHCNPSLHQSFLALEHHTFHQGYIQWRSTHISPGGLMEATDQKAGSIGNSHQWHKSVNVF